MSWLHWLAIVALASALAQQTTGRMGNATNFVIFMVDDLGYGDLGCFGRKNISTPNIDKMRQQGIKFTQWISAAPICTPSRAALQTGRLPHRFGMTANTLPWRVIPYPSAPGGIPPSEVTIAEILRDHGYATALSGKWHLGTGNITHKHAHLPTQHGYDTWLGIPFSNTNFCRSNGPEKIAAEFCMVMANNTVVQQPTRMDNLTGMLIQHSLDFIADSVAQEKPFLSIVSFVHVHTALFSSPRFTNVSSGGRFGDNVEEMDWGVGQVIALLENLAVDNETLVFLTSDNGPYTEEGWDNAGRTGGLSGSKGQTYEGGIRVPGLARWPGHISPGGQTNSAVSTMDIFPTILDVANIPLPSRTIDGKTILPILIGANRSTPHEWMFHYCGTEVLAMRWRGKYKIAFSTQIWASDEKPSSKCIQCCPDGPTAHVINGTGGSLCDCDAKSVKVHDPPLVFDLDRDSAERYPMTNETFPGGADALYSLINSAKSALDAHKASIHHTEDEMHTLPLPWLQPCCASNSTHEGSFADRSRSQEHGKCYCDNYIRHRAYP